MPQGEGASNNASAASMLWRGLWPPWQVSEKPLPVSRSWGLVPARSVIHMLVPSRTSLLILSSIPTESFSISKAHAKRPRPFSLFQESSRAQGPRARWCVNSCRCSLPRRSSGCRWTSRLARRQSLRTVTLNPNPTPPPPTQLPSPAPRRIAFHLFPSTR
jgi:hypothetical protein